MTWGPKEAERLNASHDPVVLAIADALGTAVPRWSISTGSMSSAMLWTWWLERHRGQLCGRAVRAEGAARQSPGSESCTTTFAFLACRGCERPDAASAMRYSYLLSPLPLHRTGRHPGGDVALAEDEDHKTGRIVNTTSADTRFQLDS